MKEKKTFKEWMNSPVLKEKKKKTVKEVVASQYAALIILRVCTIVIFAYGTVGAAFAEGQFDFFYGITIALVSGFLFLYTAPSNMMDQTKILDWMEKLEIEDRKKEKQKNK